MLLDPSHVAFMAGPVSISASSRSASNEPVLSRAHGCRVDADGRVTLLFAQSRAVSFLAAVREARAVAAVFSRPRTHQTMQIKGDAAELAPAAPDDLELARRYVEAFVEELTPLGYAESAMRNLLWYVPEDLVRLAFSPRVAFDQTPGPRAGVPLQRPA
jgi:hypothetical protein